MSLSFFDHDAYPSIIRYFFVHMYGTSIATYEVTLRYLRSTDYEDFVSFNKHEPITDTDANMPISANIPIIEILRF